MSSPIVIAAGPPSSAAQAYFSRKLTEVRDHLHGNTPHTCTHMTELGLGMICGLPPAAGILCMACHDEHAERHSHAAEHTCDLCGALDRPEGLICLVGRLHGFSGVRNPTRGAGFVAGTVHVVGLGLCPSCYYQRAAA
jgi:hypothetical protein